jgi:O-antigen ligase
VQAAALALLLVGSLLPTGGIPVVTITAAALALPIAGALIGGLPYLHRSACLALLLATLIAVPAYLNPPTSIYGTDKTSAYLMLTVPTAAAALLIRDRRDITTWAKVWVVAGLALAVFALAGGVDPNGRAIGSDGSSNPIWLARGIGSPAAALLWLMATRATALRIGLPAAGILAVGLYATGSRGPVVALVIAAVIVATLSSPTARASRAATLALLSAAGLFLAVAFRLVPATSRIGALLYEPGAELEASDRIALARPTLDVIADHPAGVGIGNWAVHVPIPPYLYPHNLFLEVTAEAGWAAGAVLIAVLLRVTVRLWRASKTEPAAVLMLALLVFETTCVSVSGDLNARTFYFVLALGYAVSWWPATTAPPTVSPPPPSEPAGLPAARSAPTQRSRTEAAWSSR